MPYKNLFPKHGPILSALQENPAKGQEELSNFLKQAKAGSKATQGGINNKIHLIAKLLKLNQGEQYADQVLATLLKDHAKEEITSTLKNLRLETGAEVLNLFNYLLQKKVVAATTLAEHYERLAMSHSADELPEVTKVLLEAIIKLPNVSKENQHRLTTNLILLEIEIDRHNTEDGHEGHELAMLNFINKGKDLENELAANSKKKHSHYLKDHGLLKRIFSWVDAYGQGKFYSYYVQFLLLSLSQQALPEYASAIAAKANPILDEFFSVLAKHKDKNDNEANDALSFMSRLCSLNPELAGKRSRAQSFLLEYINALYPDKAEAEAMRSVISNNDPLTIMMLKTSRKNNETAEEKMISDLQFAGEQFFAQGHLLKAAAKMTESLRLVEQYPGCSYAKDQEYFRLLAHLYSRTNNYQALIPVATKILNLGPYDRLLISNLFTAYNFLCEPKEARALTAKLKQLGLNLDHEVTESKTALSAKSGSAKALIANQDLLGKNRHNEQGYSVDKVATLLVDAKLALTKNHFILAHSKLDELKALNFSVELKGDIHRLRAATYQREGNYSEAKKELKASLEYLALNGVAENLMDIHLKLNEDAQAEALARYLLKTWDRTYRYGRNVRHKAYYTLMQIYLRNRHYERGLDSFQALLEQNGCVTQEKAILHSYRAGLYLALKDFGPSEKEALLSLDTGDNTPPLYTLELLATCYLRTQNDLALDELITRYPELNHCNNPQILVTLGFCYYERQPPAFSKALANFSKALALNPTVINKLRKQLPAKLISHLMGESENENESSSDEELVVVTQKLPSLTLSVQPCDELALEPVVAITPSLSKGYLSPEQILHREFQTMKKREQEEVEDEKENNAETDWDLEGLGHLSAQDGKVFPLHLVNQNPAHSRLFGVLDKAKLQKSCNGELINKWEKLLRDGSIIGKKGQEGVRLLNRQEGAALEGELKGSCAKLKLLGLHGDVRVYGEMIPSADQSKNLICFDKVTFKAHK